MASPQISEVSVEQNRPDDQEVSSEPNTAGDEDAADNSSSSSSDEEEDDTDYKKRTEYRPLVKAAMTRDWDKVIKTLKSKPEARRDYVDGDAETFLDVVVGYCDDKDKLKKTMDCNSKDNNNSITPMPSKRSFGGSRQRRVREGSDVRSLTPVIRSQRGCFR